MTCDRATPEKPNRCAHSRHCGHRAWCTSAKQVHVLRQLRGHENIVSLCDVVELASGQLTYLVMERIEGLGVAEKSLALKVGGVITTAGSRNGGQETAAIGVNAWFHINDMLPVGITSPVAQWGATGNTGFDKEDVHRDEIRLTPWPEELGTPSRHSETLLSKELAWLYGRKLASVATIVKAGVESTGMGMPDKPYGWTLPEKYPDEVYEIGRA